MISYKTGDLMDAEESAIAHGCNTQGLMGAGVARLVRDQHPDVYDIYRAACRSGDFIVGTSLGVWAEPINGPDRLVYNLGTQRHPGADATAWGIFLSFANMAEDAHFRGVNAIAIPRIGAGIGGMKWPDVFEAIEEALDRSTHPGLNIVVYDLPQGDPNA
jgi:O-acetyl-ADP-ribose deacetylase (regulator of RNase III)